MTDINRKFLTTKEAADFLGFRATTLRNARHTGKLGGVQAPGYRKIGCSVRYEQDVLNNWVSQFDVQTNTSQSTDNA
jgi:Helix-turn-helix domain